LPHDGSIADYFHLYSRPFIGRQRCCPNIHPSVDTNILCHLISAGAREPAIGARASFSAQGIGVPLACNNLDLDSAQQLLAFLLALASLSNAMSHNADLGRIVMAPAATITTWRRIMAEPNKASELPAWIKDHVARYVRTDGADGYLWDASIGGGKGMVPTLLLTTTGRKSGQALTLPLIFGRSGPDYVVVASKGGSPTHPAWYLNLQAKPDVRVQVKGEKFVARANTASAADRAALWPQMVEIYGPYADYQIKTDRQIPVVLLKPV
jgi:deazaflavin-dependent oxidoreductase (nitroreductase family)